MAYIDIDIEDYIDEISTSLLEEELERRKSKENKSTGLITTENGYQREFLKAAKCVIQSPQVNLLEATKLLEKLLTND